MPVAKNERAFRQSVNISELRRNTKNVKNDKKITAISSLDQGCVISKMIKKLIYLQQDLEKEK